MALAFREAFEECHQRKNRYSSRNGASENYIADGRGCIFRPRSVMDRPQRHKAGRQNGNRTRFKEMPLPTHDKFDDSQIHGAGPT
jgi:hypothetical protein